MMTTDDQPREPDGHDTVEGTLPDEEWRAHVHAALEDDQLALEAMYSDEFLRHWYRSAKDHLAHAAFPHLVGLSELREVMLANEGQCRETFLVLWPIPENP